MESALDIHHEKPAQNFSNLTWRKFKKHKLALLSLVILSTIIILAILAPLIEKFLGVSHIQASFSKAWLPPSYLHIFGTNELGQDVFLRILFGGRISMSVGILSAFTSVIIGTIIGLLAGYHGGMVDNFLMRFTDSMLSVPVLPLMIVFAALDLNILLKNAYSPKGVLFVFLVVFSFIIFFRSMTDARVLQVKPQYFFKMNLQAFIISAVLMIAYLIFFNLIDQKALGQDNLSSIIKISAIIVFFGWMSVARLARASAMQLKNMEFVTAAKALGASDARILLAHIFPNALAPIIVAATLEMGGNILYEAALSFLGLGIQPPISSWGNMLNNAIDYIKSTPSLAFWPGLFILVTVACFNFLGDGLRDALDPHQIMNRASKKN